MAASYLRRDMAEPATDVHRGDDPQHPALRAADRWTDRRPARGAALPALAIAAGATDMAFVVAVSLLLAWY
jgi:hypothetical protein